jgi:hypothetical protein
LIIAPFIGIASGIIIGLFAIIATALMKKKWQLNKHSTLFYNKLLSIERLIALLLQKLKVWVVNFRININFALLTY